MENYPFRYHSLFKICRTIQSSFDVSDRIFFGIPMDVVFHFIVPILIYIFFSYIFSPKKSLIIVLIIILLKEFNDFYVYYYYKDIKIIYILSGLRDLTASFIGVYLLYNFRKLVLSPILFIYSYLKRFI